MPPIAASRAKWSIILLRTGLGGNAMPALLKWRTELDPENETGG
jgi:hypothetical protein